jgi:hypothetical protein
MGTPTFVYLPTIERYVNLAAVGVVEQRHNGIHVRTMLADGIQPYESGPVYPDHFSFMVTDAEDCNILCRALRHVTVNTHEAPTAVEVGK